MDTNKYPKIITDISNNLYSRSAQHIFDLHIYLI